MRTTTPIWAKRVAAEAADLQRDHRAEEADRDREKHGERHGEALIERHQEEIGEGDRNAENVNGLSGRLLLLQRGPGPFEGVAGRQHLLRRPLHRGQRLARAVSRRGRAVDVHGSQVVVAGDQLRTDDHLGGHQRAQRNHVALGVRHIDAIDVVEAASILGVGLDVDLPDSTIGVELVDEIAAHRRLQGLEDVADGDAQDLRLVAVDIEIDLGRVGAIGAEYARELRLLIGLEDERPHGRRELGRALAAADGFELVLEAAGRPEPDDGRSIVEEDARSRDALRFRLDFGDQSVDRLRGVGALLEGGEAYDEERGVGKRHAVELAEADNRGEGGDAFLGPDDLLNLARQRVGAIDGRSGRQIDLGVEEALVFLGQKSTRDQAEQREGRASGDRRRRAGPGARTSPCA